MEQAELHRRRLILEEVKKQQPIEDNSRFLFDNVTGIPISVKNAGGNEKEAVNIKSGKFKNKLQVDDTQAEVSE